MKSLNKTSLCSEYKADFLIAFYVFCLLISEIMGGKTFPIINIFGFQLNGSVAIFLFPWIFSINDIIAEVYGFKRAKSMARISLIMVFFLILFSSLAIALPPSSKFANTQHAYATIFSQSIRISIASLIAITISNFTDVNIFWRLKKKLGKYGLWFRNNLSNLLALFLDTVIFMTLAFYSIDKPIMDNLTFLMGMILPYWILKAMASGLLTPVVCLGIKWLKK